MMSKIELARNSAYCRYDRLGMFINERLRIYGMPDYYFDIETANEGSDEDDANLNPNSGKIISIQYQELDTATGKPLRDLIILKEWEEGEEAIVQKVFSLMGPRDKWFNFIPVGYSFTFDFKFLHAKFKKYIDINYPFEDLRDRPSKDLKVIGVMLNDGIFKEAKLDKITNRLNLIHQKHQNGSQVPIWYRRREYDKIEQYIREEASAFEEFYEKVISALRTLDENHGLDEDTYADT